MPKTRAIRLLGLLAMAWLVTSCEPAGTLPGGGRQNDYLVARQALETGNYELAIARYERLLSQVPPGETAGRLRLEYAHSLLRGGNYEAAINVATALIEQHDGSLRASAQAVRGTARHQLARARIAAGDSGEETRKLLQAAQADLSAFLKTHPDLDAAGAMAQRARLITADLKKTG